MTRERIVLETSEKRKAALVEKLALQGDTLTDWLEEQLILSVGEEAAAGGDQGGAGADLATPTEVMEYLRSQDWSFTNDDTSYLTHDLHPYPAKFIPQIPSMELVVMP